jgi:predicted nucleotide-binding protein
MESPVEELRRTALSLESAAARGDDPAANRDLDRLQGVAGDFAAAWSGSNIGYHACVYYAGFETPPPGAHWSSVDGNLPLTFGGSQGDWREFRFEDVMAEIYRRAGKLDLSTLEREADTARKALEKAKATAASIFATYLGARTDNYVASLAEQASEIEPMTMQHAALVQLPRGQIMSSDLRALGGGRVLAPHQQVLARIVIAKTAFRSCRDLASHLENAAEHIERAAPRGWSSRSRQGGNVFIGHGRSVVWRDLKDFVAERLHLPWDEFNRVPVAGTPNVERLVQMLDEAGIAFLILTAEDELADGKMIARQNVVHEAGLFQGRLGFSRAIVMLEEGCEEFSNIAGLGQIRFPKGDIGAKFEEVRRVLEREGFLSETGDDSGVKH